MYTMEYKIPVMYFIFYKNDQSQNIEYIKKMRNRFDDKVGAKFNELYRW